MSDNKTQRVIAELLSTRPIAYNPDLAFLTGSVTAGILLSQLLYWWDRRTKEDCFYKTVYELYSETGLTKNEQLTAIKRLEKLGFVSVFTRGVPPKRHFNVHVEWIAQRLIAEKDLIFARKQRYRNFPIVWKPNNQLSVDQTNNTEITQDI